MNFEDISSFISQEECARALKEYFEALDLAIKQGKTLSPKVMDNLSVLLENERLDEGDKPAIEKRLEYLKSKQNEIISDDGVIIEGEYENILSVLSLNDYEVLKVDVPKELLDEACEVDFSDRDALVGALREPRQMGIALKRRFYHIPAVYIEEYAIPRYVALYQSKRTFGDEVAGIKYYGEVKKCTPMRRSKIREIPKSSNELYYKFKIKKWERLNEPISAKEIGFVRLFTNSFLLQNVADVSALTISDAYEFYLYKLLENANRAELSYFTIDGFDIAFTKGTIYLCRDGKIFERYWRSSLNEAPMRLLAKIKKDIAVFIDKSKNDKENNDGIQNI